MAEVPDRLWTDDDVAAFLNMTPDAYQNFVRKGGGPPAYRPTGAVRGPRSYVPAEVMEWVREHPATSAARAGAA